MIFFCGVGELPTLVHGPSFSFLLLETQRGWWADEQNNLKLTPATPSGHLHEGFIFLLDLGLFFFFNLFELWVLPGIGVYSICQTVGGGFPIIRHDKTKRFMPFLVGLSDALFLISIFWHNLVGREVISLG